ncbi:MAG: 50S ribosomal protein L29 [Acidobacteriia bacterium]|nr:50S ribosomal protein L29 [Terriglobia bacterium]
MKASQMRDMSREDLVLEAAALREQLFKLRFQAAAGQLESASRMRVVRKDIARVKTILREMELADEAKRQGAGK